MHRLWWLCLLAALSSGCAFTVQMVPSHMAFAPDTLVGPFVGSPTTPAPFDSSDFFPPQAAWTKVTFEPISISQSYAGPWKAGDVMDVILTAYSSDPEHTDDTPHETASGTRTRWGIIANNGLPFGTVVRFPEVFGQQLFVVEDRMARRYDYRHADVWWPTHQGAHDFAVRRDTPMEIVSLP